MNLKSTLLFREVQHITPTLRQHLNRTVWVWIGAFIFAAFLASTSDDFWEGFPTILACFSSLIWLYSLTLWYLTMTTEIHENRIEISGRRYYPTLYARRRVYYADDIMGYQIRMMPVTFGVGFEYFPNRFHAWGMFDVEGIHLALRTGKKVFIKTRQPDKLIAALDEMKRQPPSPMFATEYPR